MSAPSSPRRYLAVWLRRLATDRLVRCLFAPPDKPLAVVAPVKSALRLLAVNAEAASLGLKAGMALADARAMYPKLLCADHDPEADRRLLIAIADWCDRYTPLIGIDPPDGIVLDITGCAHLFGGEAALCRDLIRRLNIQGFEVQAAVADTVGCAWAVAHYGVGSVDRVGWVEGSEIHRRNVPRNAPMGYDAYAPNPSYDNQPCDGALIVPTGQIRENLASLPLASLRLSPEIVTTLGSIGLKRIADVFDRPRAPLAARFGESLLRRIDQALGHEDEPITPRLPVPPYVVERRFAEPIARESDVLGTIEHLAGELQRALERRGEGARLLQAALFRTDGKVYRIEVGTSAPIRDAARLRRLFAEKLAVVGDACDPGFGFDVVRLSALVTERSDPVQTGLAASDHETEFAHLIDRLGTRFGLRRVVRLVPQDTHIPEFAVAAVPVHAVKTTGNLGVQVVEQDSLGSVRPVRLFARPEPIEAIAEVPDGPPVRFKWRRIMHEVAHAEGPERIAMEWWRDDSGRALTRDYFRVESKDGARAWVYREGLYERETVAPRWFLHGLFA
jgi:protein ImuB